MKKMLQMVLLLPLLLVLQGCPYESKVPISEIGVSVEKNLLGTYYETSDLNTPILYRNRYEIDREKNNQLVINKFEYDEYSKKWEGTTFKAHLSKVDNELFLNLTEVKSKEDDENNEDVPSDEKYYLYKVFFEGSLLKLKGITTNITEEFTDSKSLYDFILKNKDKSFFYEKREEFTLINKDKIDQ